MKKLKNTLTYRILREIKNFSVQMCKTFCAEIGNIISMARDNRRDRSMGIDTFEDMPFKDRSIYGDMVRYLPTSYGLIEKLIESIPMGSDDIFVDFGCGKGRVVFQVAAKRLKKVIGVELDRSIYEAAQKNLVSAKRVNTPIELVNIDAAAFDVREGTIFFFYDPFGRKTMMKVAESIGQFLASGKNRATVIYCSPQHRYIFDEASWLELEAEFSAGPAVIWRSKTP